MLAGLGVADSEALRLWSQLGSALDCGYQLDHCLQFVLEHSEVLF